ncbi:MAG: hypothetical protein ACM3JE_05005 [Betaproteobacteria bacterium]
MQRLGNKQITKAQLYKKVEADFSLIPQLIDGTASPKATIRYGCASVLMDLSAKHPDRLYPYMEHFVELLDSKHRILTWNALSLVANLTAADSEGKFDAVFDKYYGFLGNDFMVTVANTVGNSAVIAKNKPYLADRIIFELLKVQSLRTTPHLTEECKLVIAQQAIESFNTLITLTKNKQALLDFAELHKNSGRDALRKEAQLFLKRWQ